MGTQKVETVFKEKNLELVFRPEDSEKALIAEAFNLFSDYMGMDAMTGAVTLSLGDM